MELIRIKHLAEKKKIAIRHIANAIGMTENNLHKCVRDNRIEAGDLEKVATFLGVPITYFFIDDLDKLNEAPVKINMEHNGNGHNIAAAKDNNITDFQREISHLKEIISLKDELIEALRMKGK